MYIKRTMNGNVYQFPLTKNEILSAYLEQRRANHRDDVINHIDEHLGVLESEELNNVVERVTDKYEEYLNSDIDDMWMTYLDNAFEDVLGKSDIKE